MAPQGNNTHQTEVELSYSSKGYKDAVKELNHLATLVKTLSEDLKKVTLPKIKGLKGSLAEAAELRSLISSLTKVKPEVGQMSDTSKQQEAALMYKTYLDNLKRTLSTQSQIANLSKDELTRKAFLGELNKDEVKTQSKNIELLKAISKGYEQAKNAGILSKEQASLQTQVNKWIASDLKRKKETAAAERLADSQIRMEQRKIALRYAREAAEGTLNKVDLKSYLAKADLTQISALQTAMKAQSLRADFVKTPTITAFNTAVEKARLKITTGGQVIDPKTVLESIKGASHKGDTDLVIKNLRAEILRQTKLGAKGEGLRDLYRILADARSEAAKKFAPVSPFQEAKKAEEAYAKTLTKLDAKAIQQLKDKLILEEHLQASKIRAHKTNMTIGSEQWKGEQSYQELLKKRLADVKAEELRQKREAADPNAAKLKQNQKEIRDKTLDSTIANRQTAAEKSVARAKYDEEKRLALKQGLFKTEESIKNLSADQARFAKDTLNFGIQTGKLRGVERAEAENLLAILKQQEAIQRRSIQQNQNIANLARAGKYQTKGDLTGLDKSELEVARKVIAYRMRNNQLTQEQLVAEQKLLDHAKSRENLLTMEAKRKDEAYQHERRLNQLTHLEGDGGASMAVIQAGFMMRSQVLGGLSSIFSGAFDSAIQLDKAFRNLQAISASTNYEMATMKINLINVAQASKFSAAEVGETAVMLAQAGLSIQEIGASMKGIITLAQATGTDLAKSVDVVTSVLSIFNKNATETDNIVNQLTAALNESKLDINKMALGLQYAGNIASDSGVSFEELTAALGATANAGIRSGSTLGTGLRQMFIDLQKPNEKLTKRLETLGVTLDQVNFRSQGLEGVLRNLRNAGFSSADAFETFEVRSAAAFSALSGNLTDFHDLQEELADTNAAFEANNVQMESFAVQLDHLKSNLGILAAEGLKPTLSLLSDMTKGMAHAMENTEEGVGIVKLLVGAFASLTVGVTIAWFSKLVGGLLTTTSALMSVGGALTLTRYGVIGLTAALITGIASLVSYNSEAKRLNTELDKSKGLHNELKASLQSSEGAMHNVDEAIKNLINRYGVLKTDSGQTEAAAKSLMAQFAEFGLKIDDVANISIDNLINKMSELRTEMAKEYKTKLDEEAAAKIKLLLDEREAADDRSQKATLTGRDFGGFSYSVTKEGLTKFIEATTMDRLKNRGRHFNTMTDREAAIASQPAVRDLIISYMKGLIATQEAGEILPPTLFSPSKINKDIYATLAKTPKDKLSPTQKRLIEEVVTGLVSQYQDIKTILNTPDEIIKTEKKLKQNQDKIDMDSSFYSEIGEGTRMENISKTYREGLENISNTKGISYTEQLKRQRAVAEQAKKDSDILIKGLEAQRDLAKANKADDHIIRILEDQIAKLKQEQHDFRKFGADLDAKERKRQLQVLGYELDAAKDAVATAKAIWSKSTGLNTEEKTYKEYEAKILAQQEVEDRINALRLIDNPEEETALEAIKRSRGSEKTKRKVERNSFRIQIEDRAKNDKISNEEARARQALEDKKREQDRFFKDLENKDKFVKMQEEAERRQAKAKAYIPLDSGSMFDTLNADEKKSAQAKANATGVSQEYSVFGQAANRFARQAARFDNQQLEKNLIQRKLANEVGALALLQQKERNINQEDYTKLVEKEAKLKAELKVLEDNAANSRLDQDKEALERKQKEYDLTRDQILAAQNYEETLKEKIEERKNTIENLKETLQALNDQYDLMDTTLTAGVQSMTSGLSSIFSDWASGVIKNTDDVKEAFRSLGQSVLQSMAKVVSDKIAQQFMGFLLNGLGSMFGGPKATPVGSLGVETPSLAITNTASTGGLITATGVKHFAEGGFVSGTNIGRDSVPALLQPNEYVVQRSAVQALGTDFMQNLNNVTTGSLKQGAAALGATKPMVQNVMKASPPVNVYVVSPEQQRQMGQEDVVVALQDDILRGGTTKKLIKAVISGEV